MLDPLLSPHRIAVTEPNFLRQNNAQFMSSFMFFLVSRRFFLEATQVPLIIELIACDALYFEHFNQFYYSHFELHAFLCVTSQKKRLKKRATNSKRCPLYELHLIAFFDNHHKFILCCIYTNTWKLQLINKSNCSMQFDIDLALSNLLKIINGAKNSRKNR